MRVTPHLLRYASLLLFLLGLKLGYDYWQTPVTVKDAVATGKAHTIEANYSVHEGRMGIDGYRPKQVRVIREGNLMRLSCGKPVCDHLPLSGQARFTYYEQGLLPPGRLLRVETPGHPLSSADDSELRNLRWLNLVFAILTLSVAGVVWFAGSLLKQSDSGSGALH
jgi:hypothetical protein